MGIWRRNGKWGVDYHPTRAPKRIRRLVGTKDEAQKVLADLTLRDRAATYPILSRPAEAPTFAKVAARFLAESTCRDKRTLRSRVAVLKRHFDTLTLKQIDGPTIRAWITSRLAEGVEPSTVNRGRTV